MQTLSTGSRFQDKLYEKTMMHNYYQANVYATYAHTWNEKHNFKAMAGFNWETKYLKDVSATGYNLLSETLMDLNLVGQDADGNERMEVGGGQNEYALMGFFGRLNYDYKGKYLVEVSGRYDGTSRFKRGHRWGFFPSFSLGWRISEEPFFEGIREKFNNFKIRYSYGQLGNQNVGYYDYIRKISIGNQNYLFGGDKPTTATISAPVASNLSWETSIHNNLGVDMSFLNNRLAFSADFYIRDTKDMLTSGVALPSVYGADSPKMNSADLRTKGYELSLSWRDEFQLLRRPFTYSVTVTFNDYVTDITKYDNPDRTFAKSYYEGMRWGEIWGYRIGGLFATDAEAAGYAVDQTAVNNRINAAAGSERGLHAGDLKFLDLDGDNVISIGKNTVDDPGDREIIGNSQPRFHYGTTLSMGGHRLFDLLSGHRTPPLVSQSQYDRLLGTLCPSVCELDSQRLPRDVLERRESRRLLPPSARLCSPFRHQPRADGRQRSLYAEHPLLPSEEPHDRLHAAQEMDPQSVDRKPSRLLHGRESRHMVAHPLGLYRSRNGRHERRDAHLSMAEDLHVRRGCHILIKQAEP